MIGSIPDQDLDSLDASRRKILEPYAKVSTTFKESVQAAASAGKPFNEFLALCDRLRDQELVDLGVALDDQDGASRQLEDEKTATDLFGIAPFRWKGASEACACRDPDSSS